MGYKIVNTIHIPDLDFGTALLDTIDAELFECLCLTETEIMDHASDADAVICSIPVQPWTSDVLLSLDRCRIIASLGVGYDRIHMETATDCAMAVTNTPDYCIDEVATHTITLALALGRKLFQVDRAVRNEPVNFVPPKRKSIATVIDPVFRVTEQTLGIVGFGRIGTATALKAKGVGMRVVAYDPYVYDAIIQSHGAIPVDFETLLQEADFVCINAELNSETRQLFGHNAFAQMKSTAYLINTARGEIVDESALVEALDQGQIAGAGLDVTVADPLPLDSPLMTAPNTILTGHSAWYSTAADSPAAFWHKAMAQVVRALKGQWPAYVVNPDVQQRWLARWGNASMPE